jgi:adenylate cyclase
LNEKYAGIPADGLGQQVDALWQNTENMREFLSQERDIPPAVLDGLDSLTQKLKGIGRKLKLLDEERLHLISLAGIGSVVNSSLDLNEVLCAVMDAIVSLTSAERGILMLKTEGAEPVELVPQIARNWEQESIEPSDLALSRTIIKRVFDEGLAILTTNAQEDPRFDTQKSVITHNLRSILCVPLKVKGEITGVIYADNRMRTGLFTRVQLELLTAFSNQAAVAIENARLYQSMRSSLEEVIELKSLMDNIFTSLASGVITLDLEDRITQCNRATGLILGSNSDGLVGKCLEEVLPAFAHELSGYLASVRTDENQWVGLEMTRDLPSRGPVTLSLNLSPLKDGLDQIQGVAIVMEDLTEKKRLEGQQKVIRKYGFAPELIEQLDPDKLQLGGKRTEITALFADVEGFTSFSEGVDPELLVSVLNKYLSAAANAVLEHSGTIDKFMGDAVMAWFNAPVPQADHTLRAVRAALQIQQAVWNVHLELPREFHLSFRLGIHVGEAVLGLVGTPAHVNYTAIGDVINTAKRIQENALPGHILISAEAYDQVASHVVARPVSPLSVKGKRQPVEVYELLGLKVWDASRQAQERLD